MCHGYSCSRSLDNPKIHVTSTTIHLVRADRPPSARICADVALAEHLDRSLYGTLDFVCRGVAGKFGVAVGSGGDDWKLDVGAFGF